MPKVDIIVGIKNFDGNPNNTSTLKPALKNVKKVSKVKFKNAIVDRAYNRKNCGTIYSHAQTSILKVALQQKHNAKEELLWLKILLEIHFKTYRISPVIISLKELTNYLYKR